MNSFETYQAFLALKRHFSPGSNYDFHKYQGRTNVTLGKFESLSEKHVFQKLSRHHDALTYLLSAVSRNPRVWAGDLRSEKYEKNYLDFCRVTQSITYETTRELSRLSADPEDVFTFHGGEYPELLSQVLASEGTVEVLSVLNSTLGFLKAWEPYAWDPVVKGVVHQARKLHGFIPHDRKKIKGVVRKLFFHDDQKTEVDA